MEEMQSRTLCSEGAALHLSLCSWDPVFRLYILSVPMCKIIFSKIGTSNFHSELYTTCRDSQSAFMFQLLGRYLEIIVIFFSKMYCQIDLLTSSACCDYPPSSIRENVQFSCLFSGEWKHCFLCKS